MKVVTNKKKMQNNEGFEKTQTKPMRDSQPPPPPPSPQKNSTTPEEDAKLVASFVNNTENKKRAGEMAFQILTDFPNWFKIPQLIKKYRASKVDVAKKIEMLMLFNLCVGKVVKNGPLFKIDLTQKVQRDLLLQQIAEKEGEILFLKEKLSGLN